MTATANTAMLVRVGNYTTELIGLLTGAALVAAIHHWAASSHAGR